MSKNKKLIRQNFRDAVFARDKYACKMCGWKENIEQLDAHHIIDRTLMPNGGYVKENGISLCPDCHKLAEIFHSTGTAHLNYSPEDLYKSIKSSEELARKESERLK